MSELNKEINLEENGTFTFALGKPIEYMGKTYGALTFDFNKLTLNDGLAVERELADLGLASAVVELNGEYQKRIAAKACTENVGDDLFSMLPLAEGNKLLRKVRSFLLIGEI